MNSTTTTFEQFKTELLANAKKYDACGSGYNKAEKATTPAELIKVIKEYLDWCIGRNIITYQSCVNVFGKELMVDNDLWSSGVENTGFSNSGDRNSGNWNSGDRNSGNWNSGDSNSGNWNSGDWNSGDSNSGDWNSGNWNSGDWNSGDWNSGNWNSGDSNSGDRNSGNWNSGDSNSGDRNSGNWNSGDSNSGDSNSGYRNSGAFCSDPNPKVWLFDKPTNINVKDWERSRPFRIMSDYLNFTFWINSSEMTEQEKKDNPKHETTEGYLKTIPYKEGWANMWGNLSDTDKNEFTSLPNFDASIFFSITGIQL